MRKETLEVNINGAKHRFLIESDDNFLWAIDYTDEEKDELRGKEADIFVLLYWNLGEFMDYADIIKRIWRNVESQDDANEKMDSFYVYLHNLKKKVNNHFTITRKRKRVLMDYTK